MPKFPEPPGVAHLKTITPNIVVYPAQQLVWRIHFMGGQYPTPWHQFRYAGPTSSRFDHQMPTTDKASKRGIMYLAKDGPTCLAEVFQQTRVIDRQANEPWLAGFRLAQPIKLLDLTGVFVTAIGASTAIHSGPRPRAQRWAQQLYEAYPHIDGLLYCSSMYGNAPAIALFERAAAALPKLTEFHRPLNDSALLATIVATSEKINYQFV